MGTMVARMLGCAVATHWLPHTPVQIFFVSIWCKKKFVLSFLFEYTNWSFGSDFLYNSIIPKHRDLYQKLKPVLLRFPDRIRSLCPGISLYRKPHSPTPDFPTSGCRCQSPGFQVSRYLYSFECSASGAAGVEVGF